jgi:hypothetical protein
VNVLAHLDDPRLFPSFDWSTWRASRVLLSALYGRPLDAEGEALFCKCTGRTTYAPPPEGWREVAAIVGRQAGKTKLGALVVCLEAAFAEPVKDGEQYAILLAQDQRASLRSAFSYIRSIFEASPLLRAEIASATSDTIRLRNGVNVSAYPCRPASVRGLRARVVVCDELAFFRSSEGFAADTEMLRAVRPCLATTGGRLVILSSPYGASGALWDLHRRHFGRDAAPVLVWQADAPTMNPTLPSDYLARMREEDPEAARSEIDGEFRAGIATLFDPDQLDACVATDRLELPSVRELTYSAFVDPSGGRRDAFTLAIGHLDGTGKSARAVVDVLRAWKAPHSPAAVVAEIADLIRHYRVSRVTGDRYAGAWPSEAFRAHGVSYTIAEKDRSSLYLDLLASVNGALVELPDMPELMRELRGLERKTAASGRDRVDHAPGARDDLANSVAGVASLLLSRRTSRTEWLTSDYWGEHIMSGDGEVAFKPKGSSRWHRPDGTPV